MSAPLKPGWRITEDQHSLFWRLWNAAVRYQGWTAKEASVQRHQILADLGFASAKDIDSRTGFDDVKKRFLELSGHIANERADAGERRRYLACIGFALSELGEAGYPPAALDKILRVRFRVISGQSTIGDLETDELLNLLRTITARLASWQQQQRLASLLRSLLPALALYGVWTLRSAPPAPSSAPGTASASAAHPLCSLSADSLQRPRADLLFAG